MKYIYKGEAGYTKSRKLKLGIASMTGFLLVVAIYIIGYLIFNTGKNYVTILSIVAVLPTVKIFVQYLMIPWNNRVDKEFFDRLCTKCNPLKVYSELMITASEKRFPITYLIIGRNDAIIAYSNDSKVDNEAFEKGVKNFLNYYNYDSNIRLFTNLDQFEKKAKELADRNKAITPEEKERTVEIFEKISIMCI